MRGLIVFLLSLFIAACGGSSSSNSKPPANTSSSMLPISSHTSSESTSQSSSSLNSSASPFVIDEDTQLEIRPSGVNNQVSAYLIDLETLVSGQIIPMSTASRHGGTVKISADSTVITYKPKENFFGDDEFNYWMYGFGQNRKIKVTINVLPITDSRLEFSINDTRFYQEGNILKFGSLFDVDTQAAIEPDASTHIYINSIPTDFSINGYELSVTVPSVGRAGLQSLRYEQEINGEIVTVENKFLVKVVSGDVTHYQGNGNSPGQSVVIVWTKGAEYEGPVFWMDSELGKFLKVPINQRYANYLNISAIGPIAEKKLYPSTSTADFDFYNAYINKFGLANRQIVVMVDGIGGGNAGALVTMDPRGKGRVFFHELGHLHARLGDEYTSAVLNYPYDDTYPNTTNFLNRDISKVRWKHWIANENKIPGIHVEPISDIETGIFEGGQYRTTGVYRPSKNSVMNGGDELGEVNAEAWALANYEQLGLLATVKSEKVNGQRVLSLTRLWDKNITRIEWYLNDIKQDQFTNANQISIDENEISESNYTISAEIVDLTGYIKNPTAYPVFSITPTNNETFHKTWSFKKASVLSVNHSSNKSKFQKVGGSVNEWMSYVFLIENGIHRLNSTFSYTHQDSLRSLTAASELMVEVVVGGEVLYRQGVDLDQFDMDLVNPPVRQPARYYQVAHPKISGNYSIRISEMPHKRLVAVFEY